MKTTKHTPGPWHLIETKNLRNPDCFAAFLASSSDYVHGILDSVNPQDAALIAAAPEMFSRLQTIVEMLGSRDKLTPQEMGVMDLISKTLAKARGE